MAAYSTAAFEEDDEPPGASVPLALLSPDRHSSLKPIPLFPLRALIFLWCLLSKAHFRKRQAQNGARIGKIECGHTLAKVRLARVGF